MIVTGGGEADLADFGSAASSRSPVGYLLRMDQVDQFLDALRGLLDSPVVAEADNQRGHLYVRPLEGEIVSIERAGHHFTTDVPMGHARVVVAELV